MRDLRGIVNEKGNVNRLIKETRSESRITIYKLFKGEIDSIETYNQIIN